MDRRFFRPIRLVPLAALMVLAFNIHADDYDRYDRDHDGDEGREQRNDDDWRHQPVWFKQSAQLAHIKNVVVIYAENRGFDNLYGLFPGADGIAQAKKHYVPQKDFDGSTLPVLPPIWGGATAAGQSPVVTQAQTTGLSNEPFQIDTTFDLPTSVITRDLVHRFYNNQMQINGGKNDKFAAYSDAGGLSMGYYDGSGMQMWKIAQKYTLADNFFMGTFGGSFLNHQYLICACAPQYPNADAADSPARNSISAIDVDAKGNFVRLTPADSAPVSALIGPPVYKNDSTLTPADAKGMFHAVNTMQPPYQPSANAPLASDTGRLFADPTKANTLPPQTQTTIGDLLSYRGISWAWYSGAWNDTLATATSSNRSFTNPPNFQFHHQPFNFYSHWAPGTAARSEHLKDYSDLIAAAQAGTLPAVAFYKPQGNLNQHPGYADVADGDAHIAEVISKLQQSPQWEHMLIVVTYDENGGFWDHVAPPKADQWGPGTRIPAIIISPYAKRGYVDHTQYDTASVLRFITRRYSLPPLPGLVLRDKALIEHGHPPMGDFTEALDFKR